MKQSNEHHNRNNLKASVEKIKYNDQFNGFSVVESVEGTYKQGEYRVNGGYLVWKPKKTLDPLCLILLSKNILVCAP